VRREASAGMGGGVAVGILFWASLCGGMPKVDGSWNKQIEALIYARGEGWRGGGG
jgi:hypothetical protein